MSFIFFSRGCVSGRRLLLGGAGLAAAMLAGCASGEYTYVKTTSYGDKLRIPLIKGAPERAKKDGIQILQAILLPGGGKEKKQAVYMFSFVDTSGVKPTAVRVEDVSDEQPMVLLEDNAPKLNAEGVWVNEPRLMEPTDPAIKWVSYVGETFRVFRFTITKPDGREVVLHQGMSIPAWMKLSMRKTLGFE